VSLRLTLMRHAKSDWGDPGLPDHDRPLNARGHRSARAIGGWLQDRNVRPTTVLLSTALRVAETWDGISPALPDAAPQRLERLYHAMPETILDCVAAHPPGDVLVIAHNPGLAALAQYLVAQTPDRVEFHRFPTCATLVLDIPGDDWTALGPACARVVDFVVPRDLTD